MLYYRYHGKILTILPIWVCLRDPCATPNQFAPQTLSQSLATQGFGRAGSLFTFPRKGTETRSALTRLLLERDHYLPFPVRGRKHPALRGTRCAGDESLFTFPRKGTETSMDRVWMVTACPDHYLPFPVRGRKLVENIVGSHGNTPIIIYISL